MAVLQLIPCMSLHAMALSALSSFPMRSREKKSPFILQCRQLEPPCGDKAAVAAGGLCSPAPHLSQPCPRPNHPEPFGKTELASNDRYQSWGTSPPRQMARFTPAVVSLHLFPPELGTIFPFTTVMRLQSKRDGSGKQRSFYIALFCLAL